MKGKTHKYENVKFYYNRRHPKQTKQSGHRIDGKKKSEVAQSCPTLCNPMDCSPPGSSVHGILHGVENWSGLPFPSPADLANPGIQPGSPAVRAWAARKVFLIHAIHKYWASRKVLSFLQINKQKKRNPFGQTHKGSNDKAVCGEGSWLSWGNVYWHRHPCTPSHWQRLQQVSGPQSEDKGAWRGSVSGNPPRGLYNINSLI